MSNQSQPTEVAKSATATRTEMFGCPEPWALWKVLPSVEADLGRAVKNSEPVEPVSPLTVRLLKSKVVRSTLYHNALLHSGPGKETS